MGKREREKGARWEREVARILNSILGAGSAVRTQQSGVGGVAGGDVDAPPLHTECKAVGEKHVSWTGVLEQVVMEERQSRLEPRLPVVIFKLNDTRRISSKKRVMMTEDHFCILMSTVFSLDASKTHFVNGIRNPQSRISNAHHPTVDEQDLPAVQSLSRALNAATFGSATDHIYIKGRYRDPRMIPWRQLLEDAVSEQSEHFNSRLPVVSVWIKTKKRLATKKRVMFTLDHFELILKSIVASSSGIEILKKKLEDYNGRTNSK